MSNEIIKRWIEKAENDLRSGEILMESEDPPTDSVCFHAQQAVEKILKAFLSYKEVRVGKTHDIGLLLKKCLEVASDFKELPFEDLQDLSFYAVEVRYPDSFYIPTVDEAKKVLELAKYAFAFVKDRLEDLFDE